MIYADLRRAVLELIDQSTIAGEPVPLSYNNQADYVRKIPNLLNQAIMKIRTAVLPDRRTAELTVQRKYEAGTVYAWPPNCREILSGCVFRMGPDGREALISPGIHQGVVILPACEAWGTILAEYTAYPVQIPSDPPDDCDVDEAPDVLHAAVYYAAAMLVIREDEYLHANLMNEYESRLAAMRPPVTVEFAQARDAYPADPFF